MHHRHTGTQFCTIDATTRQLTHRFRECASSCIQNARLLGVLGQSAGKVVRERSRSMVYPALPTAITLFEHKWWIKTTRAGVPNKCIYIQMNKLSDSCRKVKTIMRMAPAKNTKLQVQKAGNNKRRAEEQVTEIAFSAPCWPVDKTAYDMSCDCAATKLHEMPSIWIMEYLVQSMSSNLPRFQVSISITFCRTGRSLLRRVLNDSIILWVATCVLNSLIQSIRKTTIRWTADRE